MHVFSYSNTGYYVVEYAINTNMSIIKEIKTLPFEVLFFKLYKSSMQYTLSGIHESYSCAHKLQLIIQFSDLFSDTLTSLSLQP